MEVERCGCDPPRSLETASRCATSNTDSVYGISMAFEGRRCACRKLDFLVFTGDGYVKNLRPTLRPLQTLADLWTAFP